MALLLTATPGAWAQDPDPIDLTTTDGKTWTLAAMPDYDVELEVEYNIFPLEGAGTAESPYLIQSDDDWICFCLNFGTYKASVIKLTNDINVTTIAGTSDNPFTGTFDGDGHTLTFNWTATGEYCAPFAYINDATFNNLHVTGTIITSYRRTGGLIGQSFGTSSINNCRSSVEIISLYSGDAIRGGFAAALGGGTLNFNGCIFDGTFTGTSSQTWGGFVGWKYNYTVNVVNCLFAPQSVNVSASYSYTFSGNGGTVNNSYYFTNHGTAQGKQAFTITAGEDVTSLSIDGTATTYSVSGITVYEDMPGMKFDDTYYAGNGDEVRLNLTVDESIASDPDLQYLSTSGTFDSSTSTLTMGNANAVLSAMALHPLSGEGTALSPYLIQKSSDWLWFCQNFDTYKASVIKLTSNINVTTVAGTYDKPFTGTFDGMGNTIAVSINDNSAQGTAPFRAILGATIRNLVATGSVTSTQNHAGGLVGFVRTGASTIENCLVQTNVNCGTYCGGIVGHGVNSTLTMTGCAFTGTMNTSGNTAGGLQGWADSNTLIMTNCIFAGTKTGGALFNPIAVNVGTATGSGNCYYTVAGNKSSNYNGKQGFTITAGEDVTSLSIDGTATTYSVSGITVYAGTPGMKFGDVLYAGNGDVVKLAFTIDNLDPEHYKVNYLPTSGTFDSSTSTLTMGNAAVTLNVQLIAFYNVTYNANSGTGAPDAQEKLENIDLVLSSTVPTRDGYAFIGWNTAADGSGDSYAAGATYAANASVTLYAQWGAIYAVTFDANGGTGAPDAQVKVDGIDLVLTNTVPTRTGYAFTEWNTKYNGNGDSYAPGATYTANASVTLYAQWVPAYIVSVKTDTEDAVNWTITPNSAWAGQTVTATYSGKKKVKSVKAKNKPKGNGSLQDYNVTTINE